MTIPSSAPTIAELYLAFRQAKTALYFERRGVGLQELAEYERDLPKNLRALRAKLSKDKWFDSIDPGEVWLVPKKLRDSHESESDIVRIGASPSSRAVRPLEIQLRLSPTPEFATTEVLYLWQFGGFLDSMLSKEHVLGYRLDLRKKRLVPHRRWLFEYWPKRYQQFRTDPLDAAKDALERGVETLIVSGDLASFYDTIEPSFMLGDGVLAGLQAQGITPSELQTFQLATRSLLRAYRRFHQLASRRAGTAVTIGVPIGALTSRVVANLALAPLDAHVTTREGVLCYRRYVDDLVVVARAAEEQNLASTMRRFLPVVDGDESVLQLDVRALQREGSEFQLQKAKVRVHHLSGVAGADFVDAIASDFAKAVSERRAFVDSSTIVGDGVTHLIRAGEAEGPPLRVLRDADRTRLQRFALSTSLHSLERVSSLIDRKEARTLVRTTLERVGRVLEAEENWVADLDLALRLLRLAIGTQDWASVTELRDRMDRVWATTDALRATTESLFYRGRKIDPHKATPWIWLRNYLHERRLEAISSTLPIGMRAQQIATRIPNGLLVRKRRVGSTMMRRRAELLALADLRSRDREEDGLLDATMASIDHSWLHEELKTDARLDARFSAIDSFVKACEQLGDRAWLMPAARLFLCTRPPSYFDIARRWLYRVETEGFAANAFDELLSVVNAVRGTDYRDPVGRVVDESTVSIEPGADFDPMPLPPPATNDPRIILGNLSVSMEEWEAAATRRSQQAPFNEPLVSRDRLLGVARVLEKAARVARESPSILVLPELSLPRRWLRTVANHVVRIGRFGLVVGLEYSHDPVHPFVRNQVVAVLPGPFGSTATWPWTKRLPAREEAKELANLQPPISFPPPRSDRPRTVVRSAWGSFSVLICSELIEARRIADLLGRVEVVLCPSWNRDTSSYDQLIQAAGLQLHAIIAIANNGHYSDCRAWAPHDERWKRELCRLIERDVDDIVYVDIPLADLRSFHGGLSDEGWKPLPPEWPTAE